MPVKTVSAQIKVAGLMLIKSKPEIYFPVNKSGIIKSKSPENSVKRSIAFEVDASFSNKKTLNTKF